MAKLVVVKIVEGSWRSGFSVVLQIGEEGTLPAIEVSGRLPRSKKIPEQYDQWQKSYRDLPKIFRLIAPATQTTNVSTTGECSQKIEDLRESLNRWLNSKPFRPLRERLLEQLNPSAPIRFIIQTKDAYLQRLPWHLVDFLENYPKAEVSLASLEYERVTSQPVSAKNKVRILAILGDSEGIDVTADRRFLENLPGAGTVFLAEPRRQDISQQLWEQQWDIFFFAGHSHTEGEVGRLYINQKESLTLEELKYGLRTAIERGLQLAIFNSCDGLGLAKKLEDLHIPQVIVMREPVPDKVAQEFLKYFLGAFSRGQSLYLAVRTARGRLHDEFEVELPGVSGLPAIFQNLAASPMIWPGKVIAPPPVPPTPPPPDTKANPFGDLGRISDPNRFFDREELLRQIFEELDKGVNLSLVGRSQVGKSSILSRICLYFPQELERVQSMRFAQTEFAYLSLEAVDNEDDFYEALCDVLNIETCRGYKLTRALRGKRYVLCLDEIEKMTWDGFSKQVRSQLRGLADGSDAPLKLVIASRSPLFHLFPDSPELDSPLAGICRQLDVLPFSEEVTQAFLRHRLQGTSVTFSQQQMADLWVESQGHPARLQQLAAELYRRLLQQPLA